LPDELPTSALNEFNYYMDNQRLRIEVCHVHSWREVGEAAAARWRSVS
jgi:hypothetical protein